MRPGLSAGSFWYGVALPGGRAVALPYAGRVVTRRVYVHLVSIEPRGKTFKGILDECAAFLVHGQVGKPDEKMSAVAAHGPYG